MIGYASLVSILPVLTIAAFYDLREFRIPDWVSAVAIAAFLPFIPFLGFEETVIRIVLATAAFAICVLLFGLGVIGGGDAKIFPAIALFVPPEEWSRFIWCLALGMSAAYLVIMTLRRVPVLNASGWASFAPNNRQPLALAFLLACLIHGLFRMLVP